MGRRQTPDHQSAVTTQLLYCSAQLSLHDSLVSTDWPGTSQSSQSSQTIWVTNPSKVVQVVVVVVMMENTGGQY